MLLGADNFENDLQAISHKVTSEDKTIFSSGALSRDLDGNRVNENVDFNFICKWRSYQF
jgi:hypothetical protein